MKKIGVAVVGLGYWGPNIVRNLLKIGDVNLVYVCDLKKDNIEKIKKLYPNLLGETDYEIVLADKKVELVILATPLATHFDLAKKALKCGKHVFIEKPMVRTAKEGVELVRMAKKAKRILMVGHTFVYSGAVKVIKESVVKRKLGRVFYYDSTRINLGILRSDANVIWDLATHDLAILDYVLNEPLVSIYATAENCLGTSQKEMAHVFLRFKSGATAHIHASWLSPVKIRSVLIGGSRRMIYWNDVEPSEKIKIYNYGVNKSSDISPFNPAYRSGEVTIPQLPQQETLLSQFQHLIDCVQKKKQPISDGNSGLRVVKWLEAAERSLVSKKEVYV
jgi:predicted dehydrogenase